jgi:hypothetical protein
MAADYTVRQQYRRTPQSGDNPEERQPTPRRSTQNSRNPQRKPAVFCEFSGFLRKNVVPCGGVG